MRFVVIQVGARRGYAVPEILERAGMLEHFYTDVAANVGPGKWLVRCGPLLGFRNVSARLAARRIPELIRSKTTTFAGQTFWRASNRWLSGAKPAAQFRQQLRWSRTLGAAVVRHGFGQATHLYSMLGEGGPVASAAKRQGLTVVTEIYILMSAEKILIEEQRRFPNWEAALTDLDLVRAEFPEQQTFLAQTDLAICPSEIVRCDIDNHFAFARDRSVVVPYGADPSCPSLPLPPVAGRVLFAGTAGLRKGIHYLAKAAEQLHSRGRRYEFIVAGDVSRQVAGQPACRRLEFLGRVPRDRMKGEYARADVFVLPSLAEGSAEAIYEALAAGLPVVTTAAAGSVVRDGVEGWIVPERDSVALAAAIERVVENRQLRQELSVAARARARDFTLERYGERLTAVLRDFRT